MVKNLKLVKELCARHNVSYTHRIGFFDLEKAWLFFSAVTRGDTVNYELQRLSFQPENQKDFNIENKTIASQAD